MRDKKSERAVGKDGEEYGVSEPSMTKLFGVTCDVCGMSYSTKLEDNVLEHKRYHDAVVNGVLVLPTSSDCVVWSHENERITVINRFSPREQRERAEEIAKYARRDTPYQAEVLFGEMEACVFLLHKNDRAVGLLLMEKRAHVWRANWKDIEDEKPPTQLPDHPPIWSVCLIWVLKQQRRRYVAKTLLENALSYLRCGFDQIAWYTPFTDCGKAFVLSCCPYDFYIGL